MPVWPVPRDAARAASEHAPFSWAAPLLPGEDPAQRVELHAQLCADIQPEGVIEHRLVREMLDALCEVMFFERQRASLLRAFEHDGIAVVLAAREPPERVAAWIAGWCAGDLVARRSVMDTLRDLDPDGALVQMHTLRLHRDEFDRLHRDAVKARNGFNAAVREMGQRRHVGHNLRFALSRVAAREIVLKAPEPPMPVPDDDGYFPGERRAAPPPDPAGPCARDETMTDARPAASDAAAAATDTEATETVVSGPEAMRPRQRGVAQGGRAAVPAGGEEGRPPRPRR